jgi:hypothetical protein
MILLFGDFSFYFDHKMDFVLALLSRFHLAFDPKSITNLQEFQAQLPLFFSLAMNTYMPDSHFQFFSVMHLI